jgi:1-acyl-sn-glycerol-3-phosphate acyltransferase
MSIVITILTPLVRFICRILFRIKFRGVENIPLTGACIITPNHQTFIDPIWLTIPVRRRVYYMAWARLFDIPGLGLLMRIFGAFPVKLDSVDPAAQREAIDLLNRGRALVIFPEGGRTTTRGLMPFKMGAFRMALTLGVPILPIAIQGGCDIWPVGRFLPRPGKLTVSYLPVIEVTRVVETISNADLKRLARALAAQTAAVIEEARTGHKPIDSTEGNGTAGLQIHAVGEPPSAGSADLQVHEQGQ